MHNKVRWRRALILLLCFALVFSFTSCKKKTLADKDGASKRYTYDEIEKEGYEGLFTLNSDETFSPLPENVPGFAGYTTAADPTRYLWYTDNNQSFTNLIPTVTPKTPIVIIYDSDKTMPAANYWYLEKYNSLGATIGAHVWLDSDKTMYISEKDSLDHTSAEEVFYTSDANSEDTEHALVEISGSDVKLPINNVDQNIEMLLGLTYRKKYTFKYLQGTKTRKIDIIADAYVFQSDELIQMSAPYKKTEKGYFIINMPMGLARGFYYISDLGFFFYEGGGE